MIIANMASFPAREKILPEVIEQILPQVDSINLCLNEFKSIPKELAKYGKLNAFIPEVDYKDCGKFVGSVSESDYVILVDDDIIYPTDYVATLKDYYQMFETMNVVVGCHGVIYPDLYDGSVKARKVFAFRRALDRPRVVNQLGTGTVFLKGSQMPPLKYMLGSQKYVDVRFSRFLKEQKNSLICIPRGNDWMKEIDSGETIFGNFTNKWPIHVIEEVQAISGYSNLDIDVVSKIEK